ncbi:IS110 family transposase [Rhodopila globiformis]|uniref:Transposase IS110-like N-terminal domain-containing protein n=1 Tax=Rhodopila globiformis TaxID=1071 RepID=A0A2S6NJF0_RHOGL|nr:transposase [Rhodopila globiformis]PPQ34897.1 hypothetical protein CCS01_09295 [Rhodopila globiformis]
MERLIERCAGLDVHQASVVGCVLIHETGRRPRKQTRTFGTMTDDLQALRDWLTEQGVTHLGMESTGVDWRPVYAVLEGAVELIVGNARHMKNVPGRKTEIKDAEGIAEVVCLKARRHAGGAGDCPQDPGRRLSHAQPRRRLSRTG